MKQKITQLLGWTEMEYSECIYQTGLDYLQTYIPGDAHGITALERSRIFWNWWKNHWQQRDEQFLANICPANYPSAHKLYVWWHDPKRLAKRIYPNAVVLHDSYAQMIDEFNKEVVYG